MPSHFESAQLNLKLFDLRREPVLREARSWFLLDFNPESLAEMELIAGGQRNPSFRMVISYWEMASSLVTTGAIDSASFLAAHGEIIATFSKIQPFLQQMRAAFGEPGFCRNIEAVVMSMPEALETMKRRREKIFAAARSKKEAAQPPQ